MKKAKTTKTRISKPRIKQTRISKPRIKHTAFQLARLKALNEGLAKDSWPPIYRKDNAIYLYASSVGDCARKLWYFLNEPEKAVKKTTSALHILAAAGTDLHKRVQGIFEKETGEGQLLGIEARFRYELLPGLFISGKKDGHFESLSEKVLFELKTLSSSQFVFLKGKPIDDKYKPQAQISMEGMGAARTEFLFVKRSGTKVATQLDKEEPTMFMRALDYDPSAIEKIRDRLSFLLKPEQPPQLPVEDFGKYTVAPFDCAYCPFLFHCREKAQAGYIKKEKGEQILHLKKQSKWDKLVVIEPIEIIKEAM